MTLIGALGSLLLAVLALALAAVTAWAGWSAAAELGKGFRIRPPGAAGMALVLAGVALPVVLIVVFALLLAVALVGLALAA